MKKLLILLLILFAFVTAQASHIVGGEFELIWISGTTYRLRLIYYFDVEHNPDREPEAEEPTIQVSIFRKLNNLRMRNVVLSFVSRSRVQYTQLSCANSEIVTDKLIYTANIQLTGGEFNSPGGYYVAWERCCRNYDIDNIYSEEPPGENFAGQTFYLEFPAVIKNGVPFINNSPRLFPPLSDFACPGIPYYVDFAGVDDDGDSLSYTVVTPLNTFTRDPVPNNTNQTPLGLTNPGPYPEVLWRSGFGLNNIVKGLTNLTISKDGFLNVTPNDPGLYVFAIKCEEFRDGVKIGEIIRDFQMLVVETGGCPFPAYPSVVGRKLGASAYTPGGNLAVTFDTTLPDSQRCIEISITDPSTLRADEFNQENLTVKLIALNFKKTLLSRISLSGTSATITNGGAAVFRVCFPQCPFIENVPLKVGIVVSDDACALPLTDTLIVTATIQTTSNQQPAFTNPKLVTDVVEEGDDAQVYLQRVTDANNDVIQYSLVPVDFTLADYGMTFNLPLTGQQQGPINAQLTWDPKCDVYDFTEKTNFELLLIVEDQDLCRFNHPDTTTYNLTIDLPGNHDPLLNNSLIALADTLEVTQKIYGEPIVIDFTGSDEDTDDRIVLRGNGIGFNAADYGAVFPKKSGFASLQSQFNWPLSCLIHPNEKDRFEFLLTVVDSTNKCGFYRADSLTLIVHVEPPDNLAPTLSVVSEHAEQPIEDGSLSAIMGSPISLTFTGLDPDLQPKDHLTLSIVEQSGNVEPSGFVFNPNSATSPLQATFTWTPECSIFKNDVYENSYNFKFVLQDDRCYNEKGDTLTLNLNIKDVDGTDEAFLPPNAFSPNSDDKNPFFAMVKLDETSGQLVSILPKDNCVGKFLNVRIYNRWGERVYESDNPDFKWNGQDMPVGVYFYLITYSNRSYKGMISILL